MATQLLLGSMFIVRSILSFLNKTTFFNKSDVTEISQAVLAIYRRKVGICEFLMGVLLITMSLLEKMSLLSGFAFVAIYILAGVSILIGLFFVRKQYRGKFFAK